MKKIKNENEINEINENEINENEINEINEKTYLLYVPFIVIFYSYFL